MYIIHCMYQPQAKPQEYSNFVNFGPPFFKSEDAIRKCKDLVDYRKNTKVRILKTEEIVYEQEDFNKLKEK